MKKKIPDKEPDTPWRRVSLKDLTIPESAKAAVKSIKPQMLHLSIKVNLHNSVEQKRHQAYEFFIYRKLIHIPWL